MTRKRYRAANQFDVTPPTDVEALIGKPIATQREQSSAPLAVYDPIEPVIDERSTLRHIYQRAYAEPLGRKAWPRRKERPLPTLDGIVACLDIETVKHVLTFGVCEIYERRKLRERFVCYRDDLPSIDPEGFARLRGICITLDLPLRSREWLFQNVIWPARNYGWTICGYNPWYDLSHLADSFEPATKTARQGTHFCNGFAFKKRLTTGAEPIFLRVKRDDRHHVRYDMKRAVVLDLAAPVFAHTDRNHSLASACHAFGILFDERPGKHSGEITRENVDGCLYDVCKTSELLWAVDAEHSKHPIALPLSRATTGASINKSYQDAMSVQPRLVVQPDFTREYCGFATRAYVGGWVEANVIKMPLPCVYLDVLSSYPTCVANLGIWFKHVIPATLEVEEIEPSEIETVLEQLRALPDALFDPATWKRLAFFALVEPNGAILPARAVIEPAGVSPRTALGEEASGIYEAQRSAQSFYWEALEQCGGVIVPDRVFDRRTGWRNAGEFVDVPRHLLRRNRKRPVSGKAFGNIDEIAQVIRDATGYHDLTTSDVLDFFRAHPSRPSMRQTRQEACHSLRLDDGEERRASHTNVTIGPVFPIARFGPRALISPAAR